MFYRVWRAKRSLYTEGLISSSTVMSRLTDRLFDLRRSLEHTLESDDIEEERLTDLLNAINNIPHVHIDILKETGIVQVLQSVKKKYPDHDLANLAKNIIIRWKKECMKGPNDDTEAPSKAESAKAHPKPEHLEIKKKPSMKLVDSDNKIIAQSIPSPPASLGRSRSGEEEFDDDGYYKQLSVKRQHVGDYINLCFLVFIKYF
jgi:hypothetical protein